MSVVVPSHNGARFIAETLDSVLAQTHPAVEVIVVDDGSTDGTGAVISRYGDRVRCLRQENAGPSAARNTGLRASRGRYVSFVDHDDRFRPAKLAREVALLDARFDVGITYSGWSYIDDQGRPLSHTGWTRKEGDLLGALVLGNLIFPGSALVRRHLVEEAGGFNERLKGGEDWDLWLRLSRRGARWACVDEPLLEYRIHAGQRSQTGIRRQLTNRLKLLAELFADPGLPADIRELESRAHHNVWLRAAVDYSRADAREEACDALLAAVRARPEFLIEPRSLHDFCRRLLPAPHRHQADVVAHADEVISKLRRALHDLFTRPELEPEIARLRWRAQLAAARVSGRLLRKRLFASAAGSDAH